MTNPTALIDIHVKGDEVYARELLYQSYLTNRELILALNSLVDKNDPIFADSEDPNRIKEISTAGFNIHPALKGPGSVANGIDFIRGKKLKIFSGSHNLIREIKKYKWIKDKNGQIVDKKPLKFDDHALDALRYGVYNKLVIENNKNRKLNYGWV